MLKPLIFLLAVLLLACDRNRGAENQSRETSPNASILPAPLTGTPLPAGQITPVASTPRVAESTEGSPPSLATPVRSDQPLDADPLLAKDATFGLFLTGEWRWPELPSPPRASEIHLDGLNAARRRMALRWSMTSTETGRLRVVFESRAFSVPIGSELRARSDILGHALVFPNGSDYRIIPPGALRALFNERRLDVTPLAAVEAVAQDPGPPHLGRPVRRWEFRSRLGTLRLDTVKLPEAGNGAVLLCRLFVELVAVDPASCVREEVTVRAHYTWPNGVTLDFEVNDLRSKDLTPVDLLCPPAGATFAGTGMPPDTTRMLLTKEEMAAFRLRPVDVPPSKTGAPPEGLVVRNGTDTLRYLLLDGVPVLWLFPSEERHLPGLLRGHYSQQNRTFLGDLLDPPRPIDVPGKISMEGP